MTYTPKYFNYHKMTKDAMEAHELHEHSNKLFAESLTELINASGVTDMELCRGMRVSNTTIGNYRRGARNHPSKDFMIKLSDKFDVRPSYFWEYRKLVLDEYLELNPDMLDVFLDLSTTPKRIIEEYRQAKYLSYDEQKK